MKHSIGKIDFNKTSTTAIIHKLASAQGRNELIEMTISLAFEERESAITKAWVDVTPSFKLARHRKQNPRSVPSHTPGAESDNDAPFCLMAKPYELIL